MVFYTWPGCRAGPFYWRFDLPCFHPIPLYRSRKGVNPETGKVPLTSYSKGDLKGSVRVPCGRCIGCRLERSRQWAGRIMCEAQMNPDNLFLTLTYTDKELVYGGADHGILVPRHLELFWKRLRKWAGRRISYYACGEYGDKSSRPHYHACVFGIDFEDKKLWSVKDGNYLYTSSTLDGLWTHGMCTIGALTFESAAYVARYVMKKRFGKSSGEYSALGITPEFSRMSRRPAIGASWFDKFEKDVFPKGVFEVNGVESNPPRYFMNRYEKTHPLHAEDLKAERAKKAEANWEENEPRRLKARESAKKSYISLLTRKLD